MTPHHLHATAAAWSLHEARQTLADLARDEAAQIVAERLEAPSVLHSPAWGRRHALGGHGDPTPGMAVLAGGRPAARRNRWAEMAARADQKLRWLVGQIRLVDAPPVLPRILAAEQHDPEADPLDGIIVALRYTQPGAARTLAQHLADEERWVREAIRQPRPTEPLIGVPCPHCGERQLVVQTAGPEHAWTVVCAAGRVCLGAECGCGMPGAVEGVAHIWPRSVVLGAVAGAAPTQPTQEA